MRRAAGIELIARSGCDVCSAQLCCVATRAQAANDIIRANGETRRKMMAMRLRRSDGIDWVAAVLVLMMLAARAAFAATGVWEQPASALAEQIAVLMGPGQARMTLRNASSIAKDDLPGIRKLLVQDLKVRGVTIAGAESANEIRVTLSENARERLWVAEIVEGNVTQVAMVHAELSAPRAAATTGGVMLRGQMIFSSREPVLAIGETANGLIVVEPEAIAIEQYRTAQNKAADWHEIKRVEMAQRRPLARDARGEVTADATHFDARVAGTQCEGNFLGEWVVSCHESDDPIPLVMPLAERTGGSGLHAFYNGARNSFTGVVTPSVGVDLPAFYAAAMVPRAVGNAALVIGGVDGRVQMVENGALHAVSGTRDWGSDFAAVESGCGAGTQVIASGSGAAMSDSLRAYELPALEAVPVSAPLAMNGAVMALWSAPDGKSVIAVVRGAGDTYEVDRVTAFCN